ncbi:MAG: hypothetical protein QNJ97_24645 [Myxococcota bacterium]|nr:hypothetical protein [Myxococcota bacterium]
MFLRIAALTVWCLLMVSCTEDIDTADQVAVNSKSAALAAASTEVPHGNGPSTPVSIRWQGLDKDSKKLLSDLTLSLQNIASYPIDFQVSAEFSGLMGKIQMVDLGKHSLASDASIDLSVSAADFPLQCHKGACQVRAEVAVFYEGDGEETKPLVFPSDTIYYSHTGNFSKIEIFTEKTLIEKNNGRLWGRDGNKPFAKGTVLGRVKKNKKGNEFEEVRAMSDEAAVVVDGQIIGWETGADISIGFDTDIGEIQ